MNIQLSFRHLMTILALSFFNFSNIYAQDDAQEAKVKFLDRSQLTFELVKAEIIDVETRPFDATTNVISSAKIALTLNLSDDGCGLKEKSDIILDVSGSLDRDGKAVAVTPYITRDNPNGYGCLDYGSASAKPKKQISLLLSVVNGMSREAFNDVIKTIEIKNNTSKESLKINILVNQIKNIIEIVNQ